eukprot:6336618-Amphidinium_carterae.1
MVKVVVFPYNKRGHVLNYGARIEIRCFGDVNQQRLKSHTFVLIVQPKAVEVFSHRLRGTSIGCSGQCNKLMLCGLVHCYK